MFALETLECRRNARENELFEIADQLNAELHDLERTIAELHEEYTPWSVGAPGRRSRCGHPE